MWRGRAGSDLVDAATETVIWFAATLDIQSSNCFSPCFHTLLIIGLVALMVLWGMCPQRSTMISDAQERQGNSREVDGRRPVNVIGRLRLTRCHSLGWNGDGCGSEVGD